ncbi:MAG: bifunctional demethylmenaquinone methyltransferase/2-methoxy-6-polyprenyl-1,4-benzoquinol methylase UbiE [Syntrophobacteraceae bacterium]
MQPMPQQDPNHSSATPAVGDGLTHFGYLRVPETDKERWVRRHFNTVADKYDFMNSLLSLGTHHIWKRIAVHMMGLRSGDRVLDVCGGTADLALLAAKDVGPGGQVVVYDINRAMMLAGLPKVAASPNGGRIRYIEGDAEHIAFEDNCFDGSMVGFGIRNLTHMEQGFREMHRILKPGGVLMCLEFSEPVTPWFRALYDFYSFYIMPNVGKILGGSRPAYTYLPESIRLFPGPDELKSRLEAIGFRHVRYRRLTDGIAVVHVGIKA